VSQSRLQCRRLYLAISHLPPLLSRNGVNKFAVLWGPQHYRYLYRSHLLQGRPADGRPPGSKALQLKGLQLKLQASSLNSWSPGDSVAGQVRFGGRIGRHTSSEAYVPCLKKTRVKRSLTMVWGTVCNSKSVTACTFCDNPLAYGGSQYKTNLLTFGAHTLCPLPLCVVSCFVSLSCLSSEKRVLGSSIPLAAYGIHCLSLFGPGLEREQGVRPSM
jgi:hypothetical protein